MKRLKMQKSGWWSFTLPFKVWEE